MNLTEKYNVPGPRYTSYPTVPFWDENTFTIERWQHRLDAALSGHTPEQGISLYVHLPFCQSLCTFCACNKHITVNHRVEQIYIRHLLLEWKQLINRMQTLPRIHELHLGGGTPTFFSPESLHTLIMGILKNTLPAESRSFSIEGHPNNTSRAHLETLAGLGFDRVSFGVQDYDSRVQQAINRIQPFENVQMVTTQARDLGFSSVTHDLIFGLPFQTLESICTTMEKTLSIRPDRIALYSYAHVPWIKGTGQRAYSEVDLPNSRVKRQLYEVSRQGLLDAGYVEIGMDHFALPEEPLCQAMRAQRLHRNFMGYTEFETDVLLGIGMSAISDCWNGFSQNAKTVREYYARINSGKSPTMRGHILDKQDLVMRRHILDLMCKFQTPWQTDDHGYRELIKRDLEEMADDGLVEVTEDAVTVTKCGRSFVRNICMAFDLRLKNSQASQPIFSMTV